MASGGAIVGVGPRAPYQAAHLMSTSIPYRLLLDPDDRLTPALDLHRQSLLGFLFNLRAWLRWVRAFLRHRRQYRITGHYSAVPTVAVVTPDGGVPWIRRGRGIGDYPPLDDALAALAAATGNTGLA